MLEKFILPEKPQETHYLCSETATYISSKKEIEGNDTEDQEEIDGNRIAYYLIN